MNDLLLFRYQTFHENSTKVKVQKGLYKLSNGQVFVESFPEVYKMNNDLAVLEVNI